MTKKYRRVPAWKELRDARRERETRTRRTGHPPKDDFLERILIAMDDDRPGLAFRLGINEEELDGITGGRTEVIAVDQSEVWGRLAEYVNERIAAYMAIREELNRKLRIDRQQRALERIRIEQR